MPDQSHLDSRYFVDNTVYNCPFCNRRHVAYHVYASVKFDWTDKKTCACYFVRCESCDARSMHLTFKDLKIFNSGTFKGSQSYLFDFAKGVDVGAALDQAFLLFRSYFIFCP